MSSLPKNNLMIYNVDLQQKIRSISTDENIPALIDGLRKIWGNVEIDCTGDIAVWDNTD